MDASSLATARCRPRQGSGDRLPEAEIRRLLELLPDWELAADGGSISRHFRFRDFHQTLGFINAVGWMANTQNHHPDLAAGYGHCRLSWSTHDVGGLSLNDFICAARSERLARGD